MPLPHTYFCYSTTFQLDPHNVCAPMGLARDTWGSLRRVGEISDLILWCPAWGTQSGFLSQAQTLVALQVKIYQVRKHSAQWSSVNTLGRVRLAKGAAAPFYIQGLIRWYTGTLERGCFRYSWPWGNATETI